MDQDPGTEELSLDSILQVTDVQVVQSVDAGSLKWILKKLQQADEGQGERIAALERANEALKEQLEQLKEQQNGLALQTFGGGGLEDGRVSPDGKENGVQVLKGLPKRVDALEMAIKLGAHKLGAQPQGDAGSDVGEKLTDAETGSRQGSRSASADGGAAAEQQQEGNAGEEMGGEGSGSADAGGSRPQKQMALPELQRRLEDLEAKLKEAEKVLPTAKKAAEQAAAKAVEKAGQAGPHFFTAGLPRKGSAGPGLDAAGVDGAQGIVGNAGAMGGAGLEGSAGVGGRTGSAGGAGAAGKAGEAGRDGAPGTVRVLHLNDDGSVDPTQLIKVVNEGAADIAQLRMLLDVLHRKQDQAALAGLQDHAGGALSSYQGSQATGGAGGAALEGAEAGLSAQQQQAMGDGKDAGRNPVDGGRSDQMPGKGRGFPWDPTKATAALQGVHSVEDTLPFIKDLYDMVSGKVDRLPFEDLLRRVDRIHQMAASTGREHVSHEMLPLADHGNTTSSGFPGEGLERHAGSADASAARPADTHETAAAGDDDPLTLSARLKTLMNKVGDLAFTVMQLQSSARPGAQCGVDGAAGGVDEATAKQEADLQQRLMDLEMQLGRKADQATVDALKLQLALQGGGPRGPPIIQRDFTYSSSAEEGDAGGAVLAQQQQQQQGRQQQQQARPSGTGSKASVGGDVGDGGNGDGSGGAGDAGRQGVQGAAQRQGGTEGGLLPMLEDLMADKATKAEVTALTTALGQHPDYKLDVRNAVMEAKRAADAAAVARADTASQADEIAHLQRLLSGMASREEVGGLAQQVGDMLMTQLPRDNEPLKMVLAQAQTEEQQPKPGSQQQARAPSSHSSAAHVGSGKGGGGDTDSMLKMINALAKELEANGTNSLSPCSQADQQSSNSQGASSGGAAGGGVGFVDGPKDPAGNKASIEGEGTKPAGGAAGATKAGTADLVNGREPSNHRGALSRLIKALGRQSIQQKMDWFDPEVLNRIAVRMGTVDALLKSPLLQGPKVTAGSAATPDQGGRDVENQMRRLTKEIRMLKENQAAPPQFTGGFKDNTSGDYAMLAGKPIMGYRCMACDRPLEKLDDRPGPYIPTAQMPLKMPPGLSQGGFNANRVPGSTASSLSPEPSLQKVPGAKKAGPVDPDKRGPQHWYSETSESGRAAENLPRHDVGPRLPPGGWRGNNSTSPMMNSPKSSLPEISQPQKRSSSPTRGSPPPQAATAAPPQVQRQRSEPEAPGLPADHAQIQANMLPSL
ncbi:hypothetical protein DUNSADRAFT_5441 [Dunaliella salina]|uniref:Uncharacterized protein n=1 Tax=Dunaliella salina TaxID=3046 RepID=A0ABQ7GQ79_DUNSA|nr:hypothetical protein DUNSADRAFT_5441 [Dunaliella salina]|eukprot:KAF5836751.1 hypothetical protein DUNSADRAFT_5441 [Dunaliella salina]